MTFQEFLTKMTGGMFDPLQKKVASLSKTARRSLYISVGLHVLLAMLAGGWVISRSFFNKETTFAGTPPPMKTYEPKKLEFKVKVSKQARSSSRPSMVPRMVSTKMSNFALPEIKMDPKIVKTSFQPKFKAFSGTGLGAGLGNGYGLGGFGSGVSAFDFFGIRGRGDKIAILVDVSISMVEDVRGGPPGYQRVKHRIEQVIGELNANAMFNVFVFADAASSWQSQMTVATEDNKTKAKQWLKPFNSNGNFGLTSGNLGASGAGLQAVGGTTRLDLPLSAAFAQGADTILVISDGLPMVKKGVTSEMIKAYQEMQRKFAAENAAKIAAWQAQAAAWHPAPVAAAPAAAPVVVRTEKVWIPPTPGVPARPPKTTGLKEGQSPDMGSPAIPEQPGRWEVRTITTGGGGGGGGGGGPPPPPPPPGPPPMADPGFWTLNDFVTHLKMLHDALYVKRGQKLPVIHSIGYAIDADGGAFLKSLSEQYKGRYRRVAKID